MSRRGLLRGGGLAAAGWMAGALLPHGARAALPEAVREELRACQPSGDPLQALLEGNQRFAAAWQAAAGPMASSQRRRRLLALLADNCQLDPEALAQGQKPWAAILSCADSRVPTELMFDRGVGELFNVRCAGNTAFADGVASMEYAVAVLKVPLILVVGHSGCGAVAAAQDPQASLTPLLTDLVRPIRASLVPGESLEAATKTNARAAAATMLQASEVLAAAVKEGRLRVAASYFDIGSGRVALL
ncbi:MAG: carbonic anhydrase [Prochlorococcaceae cyanobacterium]